MADFPWFNMQQLNLDWLLEKIKSVLPFLPDNGTVGQILRRTATGAAWSDEVTGSGLVDSVNGMTGDVVIGKANVGLGNVANKDLSNVDNVRQYSADNPPPYPVKSVNGRTGDVIVDPASDAQVTAAVNTWLGENVAQETGYVLDRTLTMSNAAPPASAVGGLKSAFNSIGYEIGNTPIQIETLVDGRYWLSNGTNSWGTSTAYLISKSVQLHSGDTLVYSAYGVSAASMMTEVSASGNEVTSGAHILFGDNSETPLTGTYKADRDMLVQFSFNKNKECSFSLSSVKKTSFDYMLMMKTIGVIGDSLASGEVAYTEDGTDHYVDRYDGSWLSEICRTIGATPTHYSRGGMTTKAWFEDAGGYKSQLQTDGALNAYYIALGSNDISESYPVGTTADTAGTNSFVGYMRSIIEYVHGIAPYAPIFLVSTYGTNANHATYSNMISSIAGLYGYCYFVDYKNNADIFTSTGGVWSNLGHFTSVGYVKVADKIKTLTNAIISGNLADFKFYTLYN